MFSELQIYIFALIACFQIYPVLPNVISNENLDTWISESNFSTIEALTDDEGMAESPGKVPIRLDLKRLPFTAVIVP